MVKCTVGAQVGFFGAVLGGVAEAVAVGTLSVAVGIDRFFDLEGFEE